jgi:HEAT repeat protein
MTDQIPIPNEPEKSIFKILFHSFVIIPFLVAASLVFIYSLFSLLTYEDATPYDYLNDIKIGGATKRWQSAFELSKVLYISDEISKDDRFISEMINIFKQSKHDDNRVRQYLALAMGRTGNSRYIDPLLSEIENENTENIPAIIRALGLLKSGKAVQKLKLFLDHEDENIRLQTVIAFGNIADPTVIEDLKKSLYDSQPNIRWDAAISLAKIGDDSGREIILKLIEGKFFINFPEVDIRERDQARIIAIRAGILLNDPIINSKIQELADEENNINIRKTAMDVLKINTSSSNQWMEYDVSYG